MVDTSSCQMKLNNLIDCLGQSEKDFAEEIEKLTANKNRLIQNIKKLREDIDTRLDELELNTVTELEMEFNALTSEIEDERKRLLDLMTDAKACIDNLNSATDNLIQQFITIKLAGTVIISAKEMLNTIHDNVKSTVIDICPQQEVLALMQQIEVLVNICETQTPLPSKKFIGEKYKVKRGKVLIPSQRQNTSPRSTFQGQKHDNERLSQSLERTQTRVPGANVSAVNPAAKEKKQRSRLLQVIGINEYSVRVPSDKMYCSITGACVLEDGTIVLADENNQRLKRLDSYNFVVKDWCDIPGYSRQVCTVSSTEVAVACGGKKKILFVNFGSKMKVTRYINTEFIFYGIAYGGGKLYVSLKSSIDVYTLSGERQQRFGKDQSGRDLNTFCCSLALSADHTKVYVTDCYNTLLVLTKEGDLISQYKSPQLEDAYLVCGCKNGDVLMFGFKSKNVLQFSAEGNLLGEVLKVSRSCSAICCLQNDLKLVLSYANCDKVRIFDLV